MLGRLGLMLIGPPTQGATWLKGAVGEEKFGAQLDSLCDQGVLALHDRSIPRSKANIDHIAVTPNGVWVIDPKRYSGKVEIIDRGGWFRTDVRLIVNRRDHTKLVDGVLRQREHVRNALVGTDFADVPVYGALCFVDAEWPLLMRRPRVVNGVVVSWPKAFNGLLPEPGELDPTQRGVIHRHLAKALPAK